MTLALNITRRFTGPFSLTCMTGQERCIQSISAKKGTQFTPAEQIESQAEQIFERLKERRFFKGLLHDAFVTEIVDFYCVDNSLHPFREGDGR